jgi:YD repeat-containing protein
MADLANRRFEYDLSGPPFLVLYSGEALRGVSEDDDRWTIWKYTYDTNSKLAGIEELHGAWSDRASLPWA